MRIRNILNTFFVTCNWAGDNSGKIKIWDLETSLAKEEVTPIEGEAVRSLAIAHNSGVSRLIVGTHRGKVFVYSLDRVTRACTLETTFQAHNDYLLKCVLSPDYAQLATTSADKTVKLWDTTSWTCTQTLAQHQRWVWDAVFSADSLYLVTASSDQSAKLWNLRTGDVLRKYVGHNLAVTCVCLNDTVAASSVANKWQVTSDKWKYVLEHKDLGVWLSKNLHGFSWVVYSHENYYFSRVDDSL